MKNKINFITKTLLIKTIAVLMVIGMMDSAAFSQTRIRFAKGRSSTTVSGTLSRGATREYVLGARRGQTILIRVDTKGTIARDIDGATDPNGLFTLNTTGDHIITLYNAGSRSATYTMYVEIR